MDASRTALTGATPILDYHHEAVAEFARGVVSEGETAKGFLRAAYAKIRSAVGPVYSVDELRPVSRTLHDGRGSCSQRIALLEALARAHGIATRVRGLRVRSAFWSRRFDRFSRLFMPAEVLLVWPQFLDARAGEWVDFEEIHRTVPEHIGAGASVFTNEGESLFDAVAHSSVDLLGKSRACEDAGARAHDLSHFVTGTTRFYDARDDLFREHPSLQSTWRGVGFELVYGGRAVS